MFSKHNHRRPATVPAVISCEQIFNLTSGVAANMVFDKEMVSVKKYMHLIKVTICFVEINER